VPVDLVDLAVEVDAPLPSPAASVADDASLGVAGRVTALVPDGATVQTGIGAIPDAAVGGLTGHRGLAMWTEMFSDGLLVLERAGALDPDRPVTSSFCVGSPELYAHVHHNPRIRMLRTEKVNDPALIAANPAMTSINTALEVDLYGQANASRVGGRIYSGYGGQTDFIVGALHSRGGRALLALRSWHPRADVSTVVPTSRHRPRRSSTGPPTPWPATVCEMPPAPAAWLLPDDALPGPGTGRTRPTAW
jgi:acyl-CoA hydrolase